jgi:hypothetical protein
MIAWQEKYGNARTSVFLERLQKSFPEVSNWGGLIENVPGTQYSVHGMTTRKVKNSTYDLNPRAGQFLLSFVGK